MAFKLRFRTKQSSNQMVIWDSFVDSCDLTFLFIILVPIPPSKDITVIPLH